ncbi:hypothetical protein PVK06_048007 [Gossypium arboreum]|uniref:Uncharacterized protein n=1 Tax=Gossypium arboreum TaxID=29729 RepID=A0ABR0MF93_GOSAR|nr:hypothetical protein PVK06_048007 [Gossypium arboreum]
MGICPSRMKSLDGHQHTSRNVTDPEDGNGRQSWKMNKYALEEKIEHLKKGVQYYKKSESIGLPKNYTNEPLALKILRYYVSPTFKFPKMLYDMQRGLQDHLPHYINHMNISGALDEVKCRAFSMTQNDSSYA